MSAPTATGRDLRALFSPASVAVVGASDDPVKWGNWLARGALRAEHRRAVHLVNRRGGVVLGRPEEVGSLIAFLASAGGGYVTGGTIVVDGGVDAWGRGEPPPPVEGSAA